MLSRHEKVRYIPAYLFFFLKFFEFRQTFFLDKQLDV